MDVLVSCETIALEHSWRGNVENICVTSGGERFGKLDILKASVKAAWLCHPSVSCSEHLNLVMVVWTTDKMEFLRHCFLPTNEMVVELPLLSYFPLLISSTFASNGFIFRELPLLVM